MSPPDCDAFTSIAFPWRIAARESYGVPSGVNNVLIINRAIAKNRISAVLVRQSLGF